MNNTEEYKQYLGTKEEMEEQLREAGYFDE